MNVNAIKLFGCIQLTTSHESRVQQLLLQSGQHHVFGLRITWRRIQVRVKNCQVDEAYNSKEFVWKLFGSSIGVGSILASWSLKTFVSRIQMHIACMLETSPILGPLVVANLSCICYPELHVRKWNEVRDET